MSLSIVAKGSSSALPEESLIPIFNKSVELRAELCNLLMVMQIIHLPWPWCQTQLPQNTA